MPIDPISWGIIIGFIGGFGAGYFWDEIQKWATRAVSFILDRVNRAYEVASKGLVYLVKQGTRVYKRVEVYVRNVRSSSTRLEYRQEEISPYEIPDEIKDELSQKEKVKLMQGTI
jgi:hypothetical protein